ncbi:MAG TPA: FtsX-like permease family protein [Rectinemataceae bacterium]|nr:FtsX-like permease family protein [Rectinemataceae bacterium]
MLLKMAVLSTLRRPRRTALIVLAIALSVFVMEFFSGWVLGMRERMDRKILQETAHILVERKSRLEALDPLAPVDYMADAAAIAAHLRADPRVARVEAVAPLEGLLLAGPKNMGLRLYGFEPDTVFFSQVGRGSLRGSFPFEGPGLAVSRRTLELLGAPEAKSLVLLVQDVDGAPAYRELPVRCVFSTDDSAFDETTAFVDAPDASDLLGTVGAPELWLRLRDPGQAGAVSSAEAGYLAERGCIGRTWQVLQGGMLAMIKLMDLFMYVINVIVLVVAATVITNAILMNVFEKQREYGTLRAIGMKRRTQLALVLIEGAAQGIAGSLLGAALALPVALYLRRHGLAIGAASHAFGMGDVMYFGLSAAATARDVLVGALIALAGSLYAAIVGARASLVDALRRG